MIDIDISLEKKYPIGTRIIAGYDKRIGTHAPESEEEYRIIGILYAYNTSGMECNLSKEQILAALEEAEKEGKKVYIDDAVPDIDPELVCSLALDSQTFSIRIA